MIEIIVASMAVFGMAALISTYDGPFDILALAREQVGMLACTVCLSVWIIAGMFLAGVPFGECCAVIGGVIILERIT
jgi:hypothetical protein